MSPSGRPTLRDVAREAGVSVTQASRALNGHSDVAGPTRDRALEAARAIGYAPNLAARRLKVPETRAHSIGLVLSGRTRRFSDPFFGELLRWIVDEAAANGFELQLSTPPVDEAPLAAYERAIRQRRVDGFIVTRVSVDDERVHYLLGERFPFVAYGRVPGVNGFPVVDEGDESLRPAVELLVELGHRRIGCIAEPWRHTKAIYRLQSFRRAMAAHGLDVEPELVVEAEFREGAGHASAMRLLAGPEPPTAIVAFNDLLAMGALRAAVDRGVSVPEELSIVGFDDIDAARLVTPPLTTLRQPTALVGRLLVQQLLGAIGHAPPGDQEILVKPELVVRASTSAPTGAVSQR